MKKTIFSLGLLFAFSLMVPRMAKADICSRGDKALVLWQGSWYPATVLQGGNRCFIHYDGYGNEWNEWVGPSRIQITSSSGAPRQAAPGNFRVGSSVQVLWQGQWYPARVLKVNGNQYFIHYDGYSDSWNEWVGPNRIQ